MQVRAMPPGAVMPPRMPEEHTAIYDEAHRRVNDALLSPQPLSASVLNVSSPAHPPAKQQRQKERPAPHAQRSPASAPPRGSGAMSVALPLPAADLPLADAVSEQALSQADALLARHCGAADQHEADARRRTKEYTVEKGRLWRGGDRADSWEVGNRLGGGGVEALLLLVRLCVGTLDDTYEARELMRIRWARQQEAELGPCSEVRPVGDTVKAVWGVAYDAMSASLTRAARTLSAALRGLTASTRQLEPIFNARKMVTQLASEAQMPLSYYITHAPPPGGQPAPRGSTSVLIMPSPMPGPQLPALWYAYGGLGPTPGAAPWSPAGGAWASYSARPASPAAAPAAPRAPPPGSPRRPQTARTGASSPLARATQQAAQWREMQPQTCVPSTVDVWVDRIPTQLSPDAAGMRHRRSLAAASLQAAAAAARGKSKAQPRAGGPAAAPQPSPPDSPAPGMTAAEQTAAVEADAAGWLSPEAPPREGDAALAAPATSPRAGAQPPASIWQRAQQVRQKRRIWYRQMTLEEKERFIVWNKIEVTLHRAAVQNVIRGLIARVGLRRLEAQIQAQSQGTAGPLQEQLRAALQETLDECRTRKIQIGLDRARNFDAVHFLEMGRYATAAVGGKVRRYSCVHPPPPRPAQRPRPPPRRPPDRQRGERPGSGDQGPRVRKGLAGTGTAGAIARR
eukprot:TRINITY_DN14657_c0_g1_i1.p1 TRINITY_DN14657_c0_g1~~TRINITY_DN14657_c0_g1_i1.p1  ORF type:complete len:683 (+),score=129.23 TRINITY_DN14657_c0_g1_i1:86-2134(+)